MPKAEICSVSDLLALKLLQKTQSLKCLQVVYKPSRGKSNPLILHHLDKTICFAQTVCKTAGPFPVIKGMPQNRDSVIKHSFLD